MNGKFFTLYPIVDGSNLNKNKLAQTNKFYCLNNYLSAFDKENLIVFADKSSAKNLGELKNVIITFLEFKLGNIDSFLHILWFSVEHFPDEDSVCLFEEDYHYVAGSKEAFK